jgi:uncharacterized membrane protein YphA (DoxX/SURF4 family)
MITLPRTAAGMMMLVLRLGLGVLFLYTGWVKAADPTAFLLNIRSFQMLPDPWAAWLAMGLPWLEIFTGVALIAGVLLDGALLCSAGMFTVFLVALLYSWHRGLDVTCGCFGRQENATDYPMAILQDVVFLAVTLAVIGHRWVTLRRARRAAPAP